ncbi:LysR substrate-binding domain-containing protein [Pseudomonas sp. GLN_3]|uniref:LysR substrate-binding domain-containing protein n=1 Tax=Pseudomonas sp. GLN_3 TaxID=3367181 RepID=UPI00370B0EAD
MDIVQLKTLILVAELGSLRRAADRLKLAQPALSRHIRLLEETLEETLFERHGRGMVITDAGRDVLGHALKIVNEFDAIRHSIDQRKTSLSGTLVIGVPPTVAKIITAPLLKGIQSAHPRLTVRFSSAFSGHMLDWLRRGEIDMALIYDPELPADAPVATIPLVTEALYLVSNQKSGLALNRPVRFADLAGEALILPSAPHGLRKVVNHYAKQTSIQLKPTIEADSLGAILDLVHNGFGSSILPLTPIYARVLDNHFSASPLCDPTPERRLVLAFPADRPMSPANRVVQAIFAEVTQRLIDGQVWKARRP